MPTAIIDGYEIGGTSTMNPEHAKVIERGERRMPRKGEVCDMSCEFAFACANYNDNGTCVGFQLLSNGKLERHIKENIDEYDRLSLQRYIDMIQQTNVPTIRRSLATVVYRYLEPEPQLRTMIGYEQFKINKDGSLSVIPQPQHEKSKVPNPEPECLRMLRANELRSKKKKEE